MKSVPQSELCLICLEKSHRRQGRRKLYWWLDQSISYPTHWCKCCWTNSLSGRRRQRSDRRSVAPPLRQWLRTARSHAVPLLQGRLQGPVLGLLHHDLHSPRELGWTWPTSMASLHCWPPSGRGTLPVSGSCWRRWVGFKGQGDVFCRVPPRLGQLLTFLLCGGCREGGNQGSAQIDVGPSCDPGQISFQHGLCPDMIFVNALIWFQPIFRAEVVFKLVFHHSIFV